ncbi:MAG: hypothetical protein R3267_05230 [Paenisporosarcina sp.]|nr:hypothetical protein [Paenisporosarcina sp.]
MGIEKLIMFIRGITEDFALPLTLAVGTIAFLYHWLFNNYDDGVEQSKLHLFKLAIQRSIFYMVYMVIFFMVINAIPIVFKWLGEIN